MLKKHSGLSIIAICVAIVGFIISSCQKEPVDEFVDQDLKKGNPHLVDSSFAVDEIFDSTFQLEDVLNTTGKGSWHRGIPIGLFRRCFEIVPPITLIYPDSVQVTYEGLTELKLDLKTHFDESDEIPEVVYPITFRLKDGTLLEIPDEDTLFETIFSCVPFGFFKKFLENNDGDSGNNGQGNGKGNGNGKSNGNGQGG